jgi:hypothetical protein
MYEDGAFKPDEAFKKGDGEVAGRIREGMSQTRV